MLTAARRPAGPLRVAVLSSRRAPGLADLLRDPARGEAFEIVACLASDPGWRDLGTAAAAGVTVVVHDIRAFGAARGAPLRDPVARRSYDRTTAAILAPYRPNLLILCGYLHVVTAPLLAAFRHRVVSLHDADLTLLGDDGRPRYRGLHSTRDAIAAGEPETRTTAHVVTAEVDVGPLLLRSWGFPVPPIVRPAIRRGGEGALRAYARTHRAWMMRAAWGPLLRQTIALFADGAVGVRDGRAMVAGAPGPRDLEPPSVTGGEPAEAASAVLPGSAGG
jgi:phosphoribosylglycinamide formyltransferase-1